MVLRPIEVVLVLNTTFRLLSSKDHSLRRALVEEMHVRRFPGFAAPTRMTQLVMYTGETDGEATRAHVEDLCARSGVTPPKGRYFSVTLGELQLVWEQHTEVSTYSFIKSGAFEHPFASPVLLDVPEDWVQSLPGQVLRATQVALVHRAAPGLDEATLQAWFGIGELMCCEVQSCEARIWSDFQVHADGMGRLLIRDQGLHSDGDTARLVQRLQELGNYRNMALLGLPVAQALTPRVSALEQRLAALAAEIAAGGTDDTRLLDDLSSMSADLARITAETRYRMAATRAYAQLVSDRLRSVDVSRVAGYQTLTEFTERRLTPAERTCESFSLRLEDLAQRASWASSLMRTRVETTLERQNTALLASMNRRAQLQLRLQQTVEGLSVLAISYYFIGILGYMLKPLQGGLVPWEPTVLLGFLAPIVLLAVWSFMRRIRRAHEAKD